ncbi:MAG: hypothetical protein FWG50_10735 [Kiritimatiellaeota bacterium]|nr:hypothetical protein [Kiritimatiellota bacterium]
MKRIKVVMMLGCIGVTAFAGDTNFVAAFDTIWQTHNATNILLFVEGNVTTNVSPEVLYARGTVALTLQGWSAGATNYWEQSIQMLSTNNTYSEIGRTNVIRQMRALQGIFVEIASTNPPTWNTDIHAKFFSIPLTPDLDILEAIANLPPAENP